MDFDLDKAVLLKDEIANVQERIAGLKAMAGNKDFLDIPTSYVSNPAPVIVVDTNLRLREVSSTFAELIGLTASELIFGQDALQLFRPEWHEKVRTAVSNLAGSGAVEPFEAELATGPVQSVPDQGEAGRRPVIVAMSKIGPTDNECFVFFLDMTDRKALQKELAIKQANLAALAEAIPQLIWVAAADGSVSYANEHFRHYSGFVSEDKMNWKNLLAADEQPNFSESAFSPEEIGDDFQAEVKLRREDGLYLWHLLKVVPFFNTAGAADQWLVIATEIDDQKRLTDSLVVAEEQLRVIADAMPQIVWTADAYGVVDFLNHRWFEYTGLTGEQSLHGGWRLLIHTEDLPKYEERWREAVMRAEPFEVEFRLKRVLGLGGRRNNLSAYRPKTSATRAEHRRDYLWHLCRAVPLKTAQGLVVRWFGTWTEIDEHKGRLLPES
ncbi:MAG: PAS domain-containing protein [Cyanobacteria bacterium REEB67]|nr:PAS domain-containing protein [Cyanobacteria bacterium REEB67]